MVDTLKILGALLGGGSVSKGSGSSILQSVLGAATQGGGSGSGQSGGGLGDLLASVTGGGQGSSAQSGGGLGDLLGSVLGSGAAGGGAGGGLGDLLGGVLGGATQGGGGNSLDSLINSALNQFGNSEQAAQKQVQPRSFEEHSPGMVHDEACEQATILIRAMINAAKSDGRVDREEQEKILGKLGHVTQDELDFVRQEMAEPLDVDAFVRSIPQGMGNQVYAMSLMAVDLDSNPEAQYLHQLAQGLNLSPDTVNQVHQQLGAPALYS
jgi:uncharacterized membrane protein YebE (DUF533 family)